MRFSDPIDANVINLYDSTLANLGVTDIILSGASGGVIKGSVVFDADYKGLRYVVSGAGLLADSYSLTLKSGPQAFHSIFGNLDGNADGVGGDDYLTGFTLGAAPAMRLSLPDFMRGPGQTVNVPAVNQYLPLTLTSAGDVRNLSFTVRFDPALLQITGAEGAAGLPSGATLTVDTSVAGQITVTIASASAIAAGKLTPGQSGRPGAGYGGLRCGRSARYRPGLRQLGGGRSRPTTMRCTWSATSATPTATPGSTPMT